ncbi:TPA: hypothetical protein N0F65_009889 [Lagenidium giganteum]|uniref:Uncharacterized protein n=1 Tax=Lagenidium giganteum TaxID=4803 RepID=A0AAV2YVK7_9STRA|nr:TPA: hypothetical protein N0F65_009889 [Lagenidium giganteum]
MSLPPSIITPIFNSSYFTSANGYLTISTADQRYMRIGSTGAFSSLAVVGNLDCGSLTIGGSTVDLSALSGLTAGTVTASKLVLVDANKDISGFGNLTSDSVYTNALFLASSQLNYNYGASPGTSLALCTLVTDASNNIGNINSLSATTLNGTIGTAAQPNITSTGNLTVPASLTVTNRSTPLSLTSTVQNSTLAITIQTTGSNATPATATLFSLYANSKRQLSLVNNADTVNFPNRNGSTTGIQLAGTLVTATAAQLNYTTVTAGTASASKALVLDSSSNISGINSLSATTLAGTLSTAAQMLLHWVLLLLSQPQD